MSGAAADSRLRRYDIDVFDDAGRLCACLRGLAVRPLAAVLPHGEGSAPSTKPVAANMNVWIGPKGLPIKLESQGLVDGKLLTTAIRYSHFDSDEIKIDAPK